MPDRHTATARGLGGTTADGHWRLSPLLVARNLLFRAKCGYFGLRNALVTGSGRATSRVVWVDPADVAYVTRYCEGLEYGPDDRGVGAFDKFSRTAAVAGGEWDRPEIRFTDLPIYRGMAERIEHATPWEDTEFFSVYADRIERGDEPWGCSSRAELRERCGHVDSVWRRIDSEGYRSQRELGKYPVDEINVNVGRSGDLLFNDGRHRLAAARLLDVDRVPVRILVVHEAFDGALPPSRTDSG